MRSAGRVPGAVEEGPSTSSSISSRVRPGCGSISCGWAAMMRGRAPWSCTGGGGGDVGAARRWGKGLVEQQFATKPRFRCLRGYAGRREAATCRIVGLTRSRRSQPAPRPPALGPLVRPRATRCAQLSRSAPAGLMAASPSPSPRTGSRAAPGLVACSQNTLAGHS
jgi:hypothetical protein